MEYRNLTFQAPAANLAAGMFFLSFWQPPGCHFGRQLFPTPYGVGKAKVYPSKFSPIVMQKITLLDFEIPKGSKVKGDASGFTDALQTPFSLGER